MGKCSVCGTIIPEHWARCDECAVNPDRLKVKETMGKLQKRLKKLAVYNPPREVVIKAWLPVTKGLDVVESAKKDFPHIKGDYKNPQNLWELHLDRLGWFMEWFGGE